MAFHLVAYWCNCFITITLLMTSSHLFVTQTSSSLSTSIYKHMPDLSIFITEVSHIAILLIQDV